MKTCSRALPSEFDARLRASESEVRTYLEKLDLTLSNVLQLSPQRGLLADDFDTELERLFHDHVAPPPSARGGIVENTRAWIRARLNDVFRRHRILGKLERSVRVEEFTQPGDPLHLDYAYRYNGTRGYIHTVALGRDPSQAKVLAYTAECIRARAANSEFTAITEVEPARENPRHQFIARLLAEQRISMVPLNRVEKFADDLASPPSIIDSFAERLANAPRSRWTREHFCVTMSRRIGRNSSWTDENSWLHHSRPQPLPPRRSALQKELKTPLLRAAANITNSGATTCSRLSESLQTTIFGLPWCPD